MSPEQCLIEAVIGRLHASGALSDEDLIAVADDLESVVGNDDIQDETLADMANNLRVTIIEAGAPSVVDWNADRARSGFRVVDGGVE